jgi:hypothetical protein
LGIFTISAFFAVKKFWVRGALEKAREKLPLAKRNAGG